MSERKIPPSTESNPVSSERSWERESSSAVTRVRVCLVLEAPSPDAVHVRFWPGLVTQY